MPRRRRRATPTLQSLVSRLRRVVAAAGPDGPRLCSRDGGYVLEAATTTVDAVRFDRMVAAGGTALAAGDASGAADILRGALDLWRGAAFGDLSDRPFARGEAQRLEEARRGAVEDLAEALLVLGRPQDALDRLEAHVAEHPLREQPWALMMLALYRLRAPGRGVAGVSPGAPRPGGRARRGTDAAAAQARRWILHHDPELRPDLIHPAAPSAVGRERAAEGGRHNLPVALTSWVGRKREIDEVVRLSRRLAC